MCNDLSIAFSGFPAALLLFSCLHIQRTRQKIISLDILDQFLNLSDEELLIRAFNYTTLLFRADQYVTSSDI
jgi:hypothetical protein